MGLCNDSAAILFNAKSAGADFAQSLQLGRQTMYADRAFLERAYDRIGLLADGAAISSEKYSEAFFRSLGSVLTESIDASSYENATHIADLNAPIPESLKRRFSLVHDGGTLEHVFNYLQALKNALEMVKVGGHFTQLAAGNNLMGHGFWQIGPEFLFRALSKENGFRILTCFVCEPIRHGRWFAVSDPALHHRSELKSRQQLNLLTVAQRISDAVPFEKPSQQSDYVTAWEGESAKDGGRISFLRRLVPGSIKQTIQSAARSLAFEPEWLAHPTYTLAHPIFRKVRVDDVITANGGFTP